MTARIILVVDTPEFDTAESLLAHAKKFLGLDREPDAVDALMTVFDGEVGYVPVFEMVIEG